MVLLSKAQFTGSVSIDDQPTGMTLKYGPRKYLRVDNPEGHLPQSIEFFDHTVRAILDGDWVSVNVKEYPEFELVPLLDPRVIYSSFEAQEIQVEQETHYGPTRAALKGISFTEKLRFQFDYAKKDLAAALGRERAVTFWFKGAMLESMQQPDVMALKRLVKVRFAFGRDATQLQERRAKYKV